MVMRAAASCSQTVPKVANVSTQRSCNPNVDPAMAQAVTEPGPIKAAEITDQNNTLPRPERRERDLGTYVVISDGR